MNVTAYLNRLRTIISHPSNKGLIELAGVVKRTAALRLALLEKRPVEFPFLNGTRFRCWADTHLSRDLAYYAVPDYPAMSFMQKYLRAGDAVVDVGANLGLYSILAGSIVGSTGHIDAVEAVPETSRRFLENVALNLFNDRITLHQMAVGADGDLVAMTQENEATNHMVASGETFGNPTMVKAGKLDDVCGRDYVFGKIDIEGLEWPAFRGATRMLANRTPPVWVVEINGGLFRYGYQVAPFVEWMAEQGFEGWMYHPERNALRRMRSDIWGDVFFVARNKVEFVAARVNGMRIES